MPTYDVYGAQVALLLRTLPFVAEEPVFALKGGTAINLFVRDLPRLSVDIDLTYVPVADRETSLREIDAAMRRIAERVQKGIRESRTQLVPLRNEGGVVTKVLVRARGVQIKIEVTPVSRGCVYPPERRAVRSQVEERFGFAEASVVSFADLYAGKLVAALDRQHPRDLFDVRDLLANEGITDELRRAFVVYVLSHNRPMAEVLRPRLRELRQEYDSGFVGMTRTPVSLEELVTVRDTLIAEIVGGMPAAHRRFLLSFKAGEPAWDELGLPEAQHLPAVRWKVDNLARLSAAKRLQLLEALRAVLES
jgi:predicted nucleotidyltransferase component of viral defense system